MRGDRIILVLAGALVVSGCQGPGLEAGFDAPDSGAKLHAAAKAAREHDRSSIPQLVELLSSDDPAVRVVAITALEGMTGQRLGYEHSGSERDRRAAVGRWRAWLGGKAGPEGQAASEGNAASGGTVSK